MEPIPREVEVYTTPDGKIPFTEWLESLRDLNAAARILLRLDRIRQGNLGDCKFIEDGVYELRVDTASGYRIYFGQVGNRIILLLCGGDKSSQKRDIKIAQKYWIDYRSQDNA